MRHLACSASLQDHINRGSDDGDEVKWEVEQGTDDGGAKRGFFNWASEDFA